MKVNPPPKPPPSISPSNLNPNNPSTPALRRFRESPSAKDTIFTVKYFPYQLYPGASVEGEDKYEWYKKSRYGDSEDKMKMYTTLMSAYGVSAGIDYKFGGKVANTLEAHRVIQHFQEEKGPVTADRIINCRFPWTHTYRQTDRHRERERKRA
jgi:predicted DsbA family dithiol-disulfide isomerase